MYLLFIKCCADRTGSEVERRAALLQHGGNETKRSNHKRNVGKRPDLQYKLVVDFHEPEVRMGEKEDESEDGCGGERKWERDES